LLVATNYHIGTFETWRPTTMPDIVNIPAGFGLAPYTRTLERMVHYKLGMPQFMDHEQKLSNTWRLVRQNPAGSPLWHPYHDDLEGVLTGYGSAGNYGVVDRSDWAWSVPFNQPRPADAGMQGYSRPDEMFISNAAMTEWIYFKRSSITFVLDRRELSVLANNTYNHPHEVRYYTSTHVQSPWITVILDPATHL